MRRLAQGHPNTDVRGDRDRTSNLAVTSQPAITPEPHAAAISPATSTLFILGSCLFYTSGFGWVFLLHSIKNLMGPYRVITMEARYEFKLPRRGTFGGLS